MRLKAITGLVALVFLLRPAGHAQPAGQRQPQLRNIIVQKQARKDFYKDTAYINALVSLAYTYFCANADSLFLYANKALAYAEQAGYAGGECDARRLLGYGYRMKGDYTKMLSCYFQALAIAEKINDHQRMGQVCINIAMQYVDTDNKEEALAMSARAKHYFEETSDTLNIVKSLIVTGEVWQTRYRYDSAMHYFRQARQLAKMMKNDYLITSSDDEIGSVLADEGKARESLAIYLHTLDYYIRTNDQERISMAAVDITHLYIAIKQYRQAIQYGRLGVKAASRSKGIPETRNACKALADAYNAIGDYRNAIHYMKRFSRLSDTIFNEQLRKNTARLQAKIEYEKKEVQLREEQAKRNIRNANMVKTREWGIWISATAILFLCILSNILCRSRTAKQKANQLLMAKNTEISRQKEAIETQSLQVLLNNQQKDKLFSIIAHDLKAPLQSLNMALDLLKAKALSEDQISQMLEELRRDADFSSDLVSNLLLWANSQLNGIVTRPVALNIQQLACDVSGQFTKQVSLKNILLQIDLNPALQCYADKDMTHLVVRNLVSNAVKFCRPGDSITISGKQQESGVEICISDTGTGITKSILEKINEQKIVTTHGTAAEKGTGLGILLCREFVMLNKGRFGIESNPGKGARCFFTLPLSSTC